MSHEQLTSVVGPALALCGGIATRADLEAAGLTHRGIDKLVLAGDLIRVFRGRYVSRGLEPEYLRAVRLGARLTGPSLFAKLGAWEPNSGRRFHISVQRNGLRPTFDSGDIRLHWSPVEGLMVAEPLETAVAHLVMSLKRDECVAVIDSAIRRRILSFADAAAALMKCAPQGGAGVLRYVDASAESGAESLLRLWLEAHRIAYRTQVCFGPFRVDFVVGRRLVVEVVGEKYHGDVGLFEADCRREAYLQGLGLQVLRLSARQVFEGLGDAGESLLALIRRRQHVVGPSPVPNS